MIKSSQMKDVDFIPFKKFTMIIDDKDSDFLGQTVSGHFDEDFEFHPDNGAFRKIQAIDLVEFYLGNMNEEDCFWYYAEIEDDGIESDDFAPEKGYKYAHLTFGDRF